MAKQRQINLYRSYLAQKKAKRVRFNPFKSWFTLPVILLILGLGAWGLIAWQNNVIAGQIDEINDWLNDPQVIAQYEESGRKQELNQTIMAQHREVLDLTTGLSTYPVMDSGVLDKIRQAGGDAVQVRIVGYDAATGELSFEARSAKVIDIPAYVLNIQNTQLFHSVEYTGYEYEESQEYVLHLRCLLLAPEAEEGDGV